MKAVIEAGDPYTLGATFDGHGVNFALFSEHATAVELCLFDSTGNRELTRIPLPEHTHGVWHGYVPVLLPGYCYGYRVHGPYQPSAGQRFNRHKLLLDPYAQQLQGNFVWHDSHFGYQAESPEQDLSFDTRDNAAYMPKAMIVDDLPRMPTRRQQLAPWHQAVIYETHVRGFTMRHPEIPESLRGSFAGMSQPAVIDYLKSLGITSVELLPVNAFINEQFLDTKGLSNYWGYNTLGFFAPHPAYLSGDSVLEFQDMVNRFHDAGLEVIMDVVFNHTCEGNHMGPTLSFRGIDNASYYQLLPSDRRFYINDTGCGNTVNVAHPRVMQMIMDSLRYWVTKMGVDGFRFDLAPILGRDGHGYSKSAPIFQAISQDPVLSRVKMIAEPWDIGPGGYQLGNFPPGFSEWNDRYRDTVRRFWRGDRNLLPELARRLHGSGDIFEHAGRKPFATTNFIVAHDGFTLRDLVSYDHRHNELNKEDNNDGHRENFSYNHGHEGPTDDYDINSIRWRQQRNMIATLLVSQGVPMLCAGDEFGRSQQGNNNAYCQDNEINWLSWQDLSPEALDLIEFTANLTSLRQEFPILQADRYKHQPDSPDDVSIRWLNAEGRAMMDSHWHEREAVLLGLLMTDYSTFQLEKPHLLVIFCNSSLEETFTLPKLDDVSFWQNIINTDSDADDDDRYLPGASLPMTPKSLRILASGMPARKKSPKKKV